MNRVTRASLMVLLVALLLPVSARAQSTQSIGVRASFGLDFNAMSASDSFNAVLGSSQLRGFGAGADVLNVWKNVFARVSFSRAKKEGERAVVFNNEVVRIGVPITVTYTPIEIGGGWQFASIGGGRFTPYAGGGLFRLSYSEKSPFAVSGEDVSLSKAGYLMFGGVEVPVAKYLVVGGEAQYRSVSDAIGTDGVSRDFAEKNLGGFTMRVLVGFRR
ncbi:MAG: hypothetical protein FJW27_13520 [Acidimicrobiia bacterium]|nr:hypothetical protein [Acidimicrobiia bacterium]